MKPQPTTPMHLHSEHRPKIGGRQAFISGTAIPGLSLRFEPDDSIIVEAMLPIAEDGFYARWFKARLRDGEALLDFINSFRLDPEGTLEATFEDDGLGPLMRPSLRTLRRPRAELPAPSARTKPFPTAVAGVLSADDLDI